MFLEENGIEGVTWATQNANWFYPLALSPLAWGFMRAYTRPSSLYIRKVVVTVTALAAYQLGVRHQTKEYNLFLLRNYHKFDQRFKDALETGDSRYISDFVRFPAPEPVIIEVKEDIVYETENEGKPIQEVDTEHEIDEEILIASEESGVDTE